MRSKRKIRKLPHRTRIAPTSDEEEENLAVVAEDLASDSRPVNVDLEVGATPEDKTNKNVEQVEEEKPVGIEKGGNEVGVQDDTTITPATVAGNQDITHVGTHDNENKKIKM